MGIEYVTWDAVPNHLQLCNNITTLSVAENINNIISHSSLVLRVQTCWAEPWASESCKLWSKYEPGLDSHFSACLGKDRLSRSFDLLIALTSLWVVSWGVHLLQASSCWLSLLPCVLYLQYGRQLLHSLQGKGLMTKWVLQSHAARSRRHILSPSQ